MNETRPIVTERSMLQRMMEWAGRFPGYVRVRSLARRLRRRRVPVLLQLNALECGAACLAMILSYYGRHTRVAECRDQCGVSRDGLTAQTLARAARHYGLRVKAYSGEPSDLRYIRLPAIVHWRFNHFLVVERWSPNEVDVVDPAVGRRRLTMKEFDANFTGVILTFEPDIHFGGRRDTTHPAWSAYLRTMLRTSGIFRVLTQILIASLGLQLLGLVLPIFTQVLVDQVLPLHTESILPALGLGILIIVLAQIVTSYLRANLLIYSRARLDSAMMLGFFEHVLSLPFRFFQQRSSGDLLMRLGSNSIIRETLTGQTITIMLDGAFVLVYLIILLRRAPLFGGLALVMGLLQVILLLTTTRRVQALVDRDLAAQAESQSYLVEALNGIVTLKASGGEDRALNHWSDLFFKQLNVSIERSHLSAVVDTALSGIRSLSPLVLLWVGTFQVLEGSLSLGTMLALNALAISFLTPITSLVAAGQQLQLVKAHLDRIMDVIEASPEQAQHAVQLAPRSTGRIEVEQVSFQYDPNGPLVLQDISISVQPGQKVALVGRTGSGKSTLAMLLLGLYLPIKGEIRYDGTPQHQLDYRSLRSQFGVVLQESFLFSGSIRQNIAFNDPSLSLEDVITAAQCAEIHADVLQMPMGYETLVTEGGSVLSGGQRQRLSIARALAHRPTLLVLDEATSHLDVITERQVDRNLSELACTRIVIAHRLSTIRNADLILVLDEGRIVERGTHAELLAHQGAYATLVQNQLHRDEADEVDVRLQPAHDQS